MDFHDSTTQYAAGGTALAVLVAFLLYQPSGLVKWLQKKNYQYEVTSALYMLTPTEKFIFNSVLFLTLSMLALACIVYLPDHVSTMVRRSYYYFAGDAAFKEWSFQMAGTAKSAVGAVKSAATGLVESATQAAGTTTSVVEVVSETVSVIVPPVETVVQEAL